MRKYRTPIIAVIALVVLIGATAATLRSEKQALVVSTFGLATKEMDRDVFQEFTAKTGIATRSQYGDSSTRYTQIAHNAHSGIDVVELAQSNTLSGVDAGLFAKIDFSRLKNFKYLSSAQQQLARQTNSVPFTVNSIGIIYNPKTAGKVTDWNDLWSSQFKHKIAIPDITTTFGPAMLYLAGDHAGTSVTRDNGAAAFKAMAELKPNVVKTYAQSSDLANMFKTGEIDTAVVGDFSVGMIKASNPDVQYAVPASGTYANYNLLSIVKGQSSQAAYAYIDDRISAATQKRVAAPTSQNYAPVNTKVELDKTAATNKTYGAIARRARTIDFGYVNHHLDAWITRWNKLMNQ